ncbi:MAG: hypothetical protein V1903_00575 [Bacteroidota bacterium]
MRKCNLILLVLFCSFIAANGQVLKDAGSWILFQGTVFDAVTFRALAGSQILINSKSYSVSDEEGRFAFHVLRGDTVLFTRVGYKSARLTISDTLSGREFVAGVYMQTDTLEIEEVVIIPRYSNLRSEMFTSHPEADIKIENAKYNLEVSSYQGKMGTAKLGDPAMNYEVLRQQHRSNASTKGQIPSDKIVGLSPFMIIPAAYLLMNGLPERPSPLKPQITEQEVEQIHKKYLESIRK